MPVIDRPPEPPDSIARAARLRYRLGAIWASRSSLMSRSAGDSPPSLAVRMVKGASWIVAWRMVTRLLGLASTIILVRLLLPTDFGLIALATSIAQVLDNMAAV